MIKSISTMEGYDEKNGIEIKAIASKKERKEGSI
jgi:hypothetical protein